MKNRIVIISLIVLVIFTLIISLSFSLFSFTLIGDKKIEISYNDKYIEKGGKAKILFYDLSDRIKVNSNLDTTKVGKYKIDYTISLVGVPFSLTREINVVDKQKPILKLVGDSTVKICPNSKYKDEGFSATDEYDGNLTDKVKVIESDTSIKYKVSDTSSNTVVIERNIVKEDTGKPKIKLNSGETIYLKKDTEYKEYGFTANDNCDGDITSQVTISGKVDTSVIGTYKIKYQVEDSSGNVVEVIRKVIVNEDTTTKDKGIPGVIYLTFDDGPSNSGSTAKILDILKVNDVQATFFVTKSGSDDLIRRINNEGHTVALHTHTHDYKNIYASVDNYFNDLTKIQNRIKDLTGKTVTITRFPGGSNNTISNKYNNGIMKILREEVTSRGFVYFDWNVDSNDAGTCAKKKVTDKSKCVYDNVTKSLSKTRTNMVLMHDIKDYTAEAIESIIKYGKENGYIFLKIDDTTTQVKFK